MARLLRLYEGHIDTVSMNLELLIRALEWAREEAADDVAIHRLVEAMDGLEGPLSMENWPEIFAAVDTGEKESE